jgi:ribulose 1,5-bisphosphate carboxylase large subunit-like protein
MYPGTEGIHESHPCGPTAGAFALRGNLDASIARQILALGHCVW